jgi:hypothetical protein
VHLADVPLFTDITRAWGPPEFRWVAFTLDGKYCYPSDGSIVDADARAVVPGMTIAASEKLIEIDFEAGKPAAMSGQNGGAYALAP